MAEAVVANRPVVAFDMGVLLWIARLDVIKPNAVMRSPVRQRAADLLRTVSLRIACGLPRPFDDLVQGTHHPLGWKGGVHASKFAVPFVERGRTDAVFPALLRNPATALCLLVNGMIWRSEKRDILM